MLEAVTEHLRAEAQDLCASGRVPGYLAGVYHAGEQTVVVAGLANVTTGMPMTENTGYLVGSITKVLTTTLLLQCVERGLVDLDERVTRYLPEFALAPPAKVEEIRVRHLLNHTNGIDANLFFPDQVKGRDALKYYLQELRRCPTLFDPGEYISYSNPAFMVVGRLLEVVTGEFYHDLLERDIYRPVGMVDSCTSAEQAILRRTSVGHFFYPETQEIRRTEMFMLPESWSACGSTPIVTIADLLAFARIHLADGVAPSGERVLSAESTRQMRTVTADSGIPNASHMGLGWPLNSFGNTTVLTHGGGSPGGRAVLMVLPEHDLAFAAFGNAAGAGVLHEQLVLWLLREYLNLDVPDVDVTTVEVADLSAYEGSYRSHQFRVDVRAVDGQLEEVTTYEPLDSTQARIIRAFTGGQFPMPPRRLVPVGEDLFAPTGVPLESLNRPGRMARVLVSFHGWTHGRPAYRGFGGQMNRRQDDSYQRNHES